MELAGVEPATSAVRMRRLPIKTSAPCSGGSMSPMTNPTFVRAILAEDNPEALLLDGFDAALVGVARRCGQPPLAVYDSDACIAVLVAGGMSHEDAVEHFEFNVVGAWVGPMTPILLVRPDPE